MEKEILNFNKRLTDYNWLNGNCYYYAVMFKARFGGKIFYDCIECHFVVQKNGKFYDCKGEYVPTDIDAVIQWSKFSKYDSLLKKRIIRDCIKNKF